MTTFRVFSGWDSRQREAAEVFVWSIRANSSIDLDVDFVSSARMNRRREGVTQFTYARFLVPALCDFKGRALFCDGCDMLCLGDLRELAEWDMQDKPMWVVKHPGNARHARARSWTSLMLMDCSEFPWWQPSYVETAPDGQLMGLAAFTDDEIGELPDEWNYEMKPGEEIGADVKIAHWGYLSDPRGGSWIDRSGSTVWSAWRDDWRATR